MSLAQRSLLQMVRDNAGVSDEALLFFVGVSADGTLVEERRSYPQLLDRGMRLAGGLRAAGLGAGDRFALLMRNRAAFLDAMVASEIAETEFVAIDPRIRGEKLASMLRFAQCRGVIACSEGFANLAPLLNDMTDIEWVWTIEPEVHPAATELEAVIEAAPPLDGSPAPFDRVMQLLYTSSTTGEAKAICVTHGRFAGAATLAEPFQLTPSDRLYTGLSLTHGNAQLMTLGAALALRVPLVVSWQFTKSRLWEILAHYRCTVFNLLGGMTSAIYAEPPGPFDRAHAVRMVISAGMPRQLWQAFEQRFGLSIYEFYATAEGGMLINPPGAGPLGSVGKTPAGVCEILDAGDRPCPAGVKGEICFRNADGSVPPVRYLANDAASLAKTRGGWFRTGDIGWKDADGWVYFSHRAGRSVRRNGDFVDTAAIETMLSGLPEIDDVYVYGIRTDTSTPGEREVVAAIVPTAAGADAERIMAQCLDRLGTLGAPDLIQIVPAIPKTASEKPQERHLVEMINDGSSMIHNRKGPTKIRAMEGKEDDER